MTETVRIEEMIYGGSGGARDAGAALAAAGDRRRTVPFVLPGELVEIKLQDSKAQLERILEPSPDRVEPKCVHFGVCGGCHYQHASYASQVVIKAAVLRNTLVSAGTAALPEITLHASQPWSYRNRIRLRVGLPSPGTNPDMGDEIRVGYNRRDTAASDSFLPITMCPIAAPLLWRAAEAFLALAKTEANVDVWMRSAVELELFTTSDETKLQFVLFTRNAPDHGFSAFCEAVQRALPELAGAGVALLPKQHSSRGRRSESTRPGAHWGAPGLRYSVENERYWISRGSFFQTNRFLVAELSRRVTQDREGSLAWDLYAGVGLFSQALTKSFTHVVAVEAAMPAAADLASALKGQHRALPMTTVDFLQAAVVQRERPDLIVMDPPRAGLGPEVCALLARIRASQLIYVSCDPVTLARDLKQLTDAGYRVERLDLVDMFPQTFHIETVAVLFR